jgi:hypothetical protein
LLGKAANAAAQPPSPPPQITTSAESSSLFTGETIVFFECG